MSFRGHNGHGLRRCLENLHQARGELDYYVPDRRRPDHVYPGTSLICNDRQPPCDSEEQSKRPHSSIQAPANNAFITAQATPDGQFQGKNALGATLTYLQYKAYSVTPTDFVGYTAATGRDIPMTASQTQGNVTLSVTEIATSSKTGTAIKASITNNGSSSVDVYGDQARLVAKASGTEMQASMNIMAPQDITTIDPGATVTQIIWIDASLLGGDYALTVSADSMDPSMGISDFHLILHVSTGS
jgi:hypothetical protein